MEEKRTNPAELTVEEINVYTVDCGNTRYRCMHDCIMTMDCLKKKSWKCRVWLMYIKKMDWHISL